VAQGYAPRLETLEVDAPSHTISKKIHAVAPCSSGFQTAQQ
jgi:hypothetical protein